MSPVVQTSSLDPAYLRAAVTASWKGTHNGADIPASELDYWVRKASSPEEYSDRVVRIGWNRYWESRMEPGNTGSSNPAFGDMPALYQPTTGANSMKLGIPQKEVVTKFAAKFGLPSGEAAAQEWTHKLAQQMKFSFPAEGWGHKSAGAGRPHSKDCIALKSPFIGWDTLGNAGTSSPTLQLDNDSIDLSGQLYEEVDAVDHIGSGSTVPVPPTQPPTTPPSADVYTEILAELKKHTVLLTAIAGGMSQLPATLGASLDALKASFDKGVKIRF